jgi:hypothetical protein
MERSSFVACSPATMRNGVHDDFYYCFVDPFQNSSWIPLICSSDRFRRTGACEVCGDQTSGRQPTGVGGREAEGWQARGRGSATARAAAAGGQRISTAAVLGQLLGLSAACAGAPGVVRRRCLWRLTSARAAPRRCMHSGDRMAVDPVSSMLAGVTNTASQQAEYPPAVSLSRDARGARAQGGSARRPAQQEQTRPWNGLMRSRGRSCVSRLSTFC